MATNSVELTPAFTGPTRRISGSFSSGDLALQLDDGAECRCLPAMSSLRTELATRWRVVGNVPATWLLSSSEPSAVGSALHVSDGGPTGYV